MSMGNGTTKNSSQIKSYTRGEYEIEQNKFSFSEGLWMNKSDLVILKSCEIIKSRKLS